MGVKEWKQENKVVTIDILLIYTKHNGAKRKQLVFDTYLNFNIGK